MNHKPAILLIVLLLLGGIVAQRFCPPDRVEMWHDLDGDGAPDILVTYQFVKEKGKLMEVERTDRFEYESPFGRRK